MAQPFKLLIGPQLVRDMGHHLARVLPGFDRRRFEALASDGLDALEMKARMMKIADALEQTLPASFADAADAIERSLAPPPTQEPTDGAIVVTDNTQGLAGWAVWPLGEYVARRGLDEPERALHALHALTQRFSAEFAIRPFLDRHPELSFATLERWLADPSAHVRRLVSEGSRPRLPWGQRLGALVADPSPTLPLLRSLMDDASEYVRRSVANHLNDIAKDHPDVVVRWVKEHLPEAGTARRAMLRHASRGLIKQGHAGMLHTWGLGQPLVGEVELALSPRRIRIGESIAIELTVRSTARRAQALEIDYAVHHRKADGSLSPKVFKGWRIELAPGESRVLARQHSLRPVTTRTYRSGAHLLDVRVNGQVMAEATFELRPAATQIPTETPARDRKRVGISSGAPSRRRRSPP